MLFFVTGLPGAFADWCEAVVVRLVEQALGPVQVLHADTLAQLALSAIGAGASRAVVSTRHPGGGICGALMQSGRNFVIAVDDPRSALLDLVLDEGASLGDAVQAVASAAAVLWRSGAAPGALVLQRDRDWLDPASAALAIARHLQLDLDAAAIAALLPELPADYMTPSRHDAIAWWNTLTAGQQALVSGALEPFVAASDGDGAIALSWRSELFFGGAALDERVSGPVDITGRAHCLLAGPFIALPAGSWSLSLALELFGPAAEREFLVEVCADRLLASGTLPPQHAESGEIEFEFELEETNEAPLSIRISTTRAAFDGAIAVGEARLVLAADPPAEAESPQVPAET